MEIVILPIIMLALFVASYIMKRRFGLLGLALAAGSLLSGIWGFDAGLVASLFGAPTSQYTSAAVSAIIVLLPAGVLLFHGSTYKGMIGRLIGAGLFTLLATAFIIDPLSRVLMPQGFGADIFNWLVINRDTIIGAGLLAAVVDLFLTKPAHLSKHHRSH